jgi:hypothetical protein
LIIRTYACLNRNCRHEFDWQHQADNGGAFPACPRCRGLRTQWVPKPIALRSSATTTTDQISRQLAADFGLTNFATPQIGKPAVRKGPSAGKNTFEPAPGWKIDLPDYALTGGGKAVCAPTGVTAKIKVDPNAGALTEKDPKMGMAEMRRNTAIAGSHRPTSGKGG